MLKKEPDINVVAAMDDYNFEMGKIAELKPNILLIDLGLTNFNSIELVRKIKSEFPELKIVIMDLLPIHDDILKFIESGVSGFLVKDATLMEYSKTIRLVMKGENVLPTKLTESLFSQIMDVTVDELSSSNVVESVKMTNREREIVALISSGYSNKEIAYQLKISIFTVKSHVHNILEKMALNTRVQIAINANKISPYKK